MLLLPALLFCTALLLLLRCCCCCYLLLSLACAGLAAFLLLPLLLLLPACPGLGFDPTALSGGGHRRLPHSNCATAASRHAVLLFAAAACMSGSGVRSHDALWRWLPKPTPLQLRHWCFQLRNGDDFACRARVGARACDRLERRAACFKHAPARVSMFQTH